MCFFSLVSTCMRICLTSDRGVTPYLESGYDVIMSLLKCREGVVCMLHGNWQFACRVSLPFHMHVNRVSYNSDHLPRFRFIVCGFASISCVVFRLWLTSC